MLIAIDGNEANIAERVGVNQYSFELLWGLYKLQDNKTKYYIYLKKAPNNGLPKETNSWKYKILPGGKLWVLAKLLPSLMLGEKPDVFFSPNHYLPPFTRIPSVCTIHDLGYLKFSEQFRKYDFWQLKYWSAISIIISKYIICPSIATKKDIVRLYPFASKKVHVVYHGYNSSQFHMNISKKIVRLISKKYGITNNYILFLSTLKPSKNIEGLILAVCDLLKDFDYKLVIAGKKGWFYESVFKKVQDLDLQDSVIFTGYLPEEDKPAIISGARAYILPSFWEGFGMDVLNSLACGTPVIISKVASLPEVAGRAGIYIDPYDIESITSGVKKVLTMSSEEYNEQVRLGLKQVSQFSWELSAKKTFEILSKSKR